MFNKQFITSYFSFFSIIFISFFIFYITLVKNNNLILHYDRIELIYLFCY